MEAATWLSGKDRNSAERFHTTDLLHIRFCSGEGCFMQTQCAETLVIDHANKPPLTVAVRLQMHLEFLVTLMNHQRLLLCPGMLRKLLLMVFELTVRKKKGASASITLSC